MFGINSETWLSAWGKVGKQANDLKSEENMFALLKYSGGVVTVYLTDDLKSGTI